MNDYQKNINTHLDSLTIKEIAGIFQRIDNQILDLLSCSSEDFLRLNTDFKKFYKQAKTISANASEVFTSLSDKDNANLLDKLQLIFKDIKSFKDPVFNQVQTGIERIQQVFSILNHLDLPLKNINQDLMTLKFLMANLKLSSSGYVDERPDESRMELSNFNSLIDAIILEGCECEKSLIKTNNELSSTLNDLQRFKTRNQNELDGILNDIHYALIMFAEKHEETSRLIPQLTQKTDSCSNSIAEIITNLQYQDIIRQKMEHIQIAHKNLLDEIDKFNGNENPGTDSNSVIYSHIRDISGIQAAMLVKANREYQTAVEVITSKFESIVNELSAISQMCQNLNIVQQDSNETLLPEILSKLRNSSEGFTNIIDKQEAANQNAKQVAESTKQTFYKLEALLKNFSGLKQALDTIFQHTLSSPDMPNQIKDTVNQIGNVYEDTERFVMAAKDLSKELPEQCNHIYDSFNTSTIAYNAVESLLYIPENLNLVLAQLNEKANRVTLLNTQNLELSTTISDDVKESIKQIKYYQHFENTIIDIIIELNEIYKKLKGSEDLTNDENLQKFKKLYTMASEHQIHDAIVDNQLNIEIVNGAAIDKLQENESSSEVELF